MEERFRSFLKGRKKEVKGKDLISEAMKIMDEELDVKIKKDLLKCDDKNANIKRKSRGYEMESLEQVKERIKDLSREEQIKEMEQYLFVLQANLDFEKSHIEEIMQILEEKGEDEKR